MLEVILVVLLILILLGAIPFRRFRYPGGILGILLVLLLVAAVLDVI
jgi:hypothetical protein